jgi:hypothetical protein
LGVVGIYGAKAENQQDVDAFQTEAQNALDALNQQMKDYEKNTEGKSDAEKIQEALKLLGGSTKKK